MTVKGESVAASLGDPALWVDRYGDTMLHFAFARIGQREVAEDLVQETFLAAWRARDSFDGRSSLGTWLISILRRKIADHYRQAGREPARIAVDDDVAEGALFDDRGKWLRATAKWPKTPDRVAEDAEFWTVMLECITDMPAHLAQAFHLRELSLATMNEICSLAGITPKNLAVRLHRARLLLRQCLERKWFCNQHRGG